VRDVEPTWSERGARRAAESGNNDHGPRSNVSNRDGMSESGGSSGRGAAPGEPLIVANGLAVGYGGPPVLEAVSVTIHGGQRIGVLGPNGGGKTTLMRALLRELRPAAGKLRIGGHIGTVPQTERSRLDYPVSALDVVLMGALGRLPWWRRPGRAERRDGLAALDRVGLHARTGDTFGELSGGQRQRVLVARAILQDADVVLFDEPFTGLDAPSSARLTELIDSLAAEGRAVLIATHDVAQTLAWDAVLCLNRRQVAFGEPAATLTPAVLETTYGRALVRLPASLGTYAVVAHEHG
jgi:ABC-type Mn2+/Zn2+ transport system ATPase subunit